jgi:hypothetical protein
MGHIKAEYIDAAADQSLHDQRIIGARTQRGDDFRAPAVTRCFTHVHIHGGDYIWLLMTE